MMEQYNDWVIRMSATKLEDINDCLRIRREDVEKLERKRADVQHCLDKALAYRKETGMIIVYYSLIGNVRRFVDKTGLPRMPIGDYEIKEPFVLVTSTLGFGEVPAPVEAFLKRNGSQLAGVAASGNRNFGSHFGKAADVIAEKYGVPVLLKFEMSGTGEDVRIFTERMREIAETHRIE